MRDPSLPGDGIAVEHLSTATCVQALSQLQARLPEVARDAPLALGGGVAGDPDVLPPLVGSMALQEIGWRSLNLGPDTPAAAFRAAIDLHAPRLAWLTISHVEPDPRLARDIGDLGRYLAERDACLVVGGRRAHEVDLASGPGLRRTTTLAEAVAFARGVLVGE